MPGVPDQTADGLAAGNTPCSIVGGCKWPSLPPGTHKCPECDAPVHNLCLQQLMGIEDAPEKGFLCGGSACGKATSPRDTTLGAGSPENQASGASSDPCGAGSNCCAKEGQASALTSQCQHGQPRHFVCSREPCPDNCGDAGYSGKGGPPKGKISGEVLPDTDSAACDDTQHKDASKSKRGASGAAGAAGAAGAVRRNSGASSGGSTTTPRRTSPRQRGVKPSSTFDSADCEAFCSVKLLVSESIKALFAEDSYKKQLVDILLAEVSDAEAKKVLAAAVKTNSQVFMESAKKAGGDAVAAGVAKHSQAQYTKLLDLAATWKKQADTAKAEAKAAKAEAKKSKTPTGKQIETKVDALAIATLPRLNKTVQDEFAKSMLQIHSMLGGAVQMVCDRFSTFATQMEKRMDDLTRLVEERRQESFSEERNEVESPPEERITPCRHGMGSTRSSTAGRGSKRGGHEYECECDEPSHQSKRTKNVGRGNGSNTRKSFGTSKNRGGYGDEENEERTPTSKKPVPRRRSPKQHQGTRDRDEAEESEREKAVLGAGDPNIMAMLAGFMKSGIEQANRAGVSRSATDGSTRDPGGAGDGGSGAGAPPARVDMPHHASHHMAHQMPRQLVGGSAGDMGMRSHATAAHPRGLPAGAHMQPYAHHYAQQGNGFPHFSYP